MHARDRRKLLRKGSNLPGAFNSAFSSQHRLVDREAFFDTSFTGVNDIESPDVSAISVEHSSVVPQFGHNFSNVHVHNDSPTPFVQTEVGADSEGESLGSEMVSDIDASKSSDDPLNENIGSRLGNSFSWNFSRVQVHAAVPETIQAKLTINQPGDVCEQEADQVADQVMQMGAPETGSTSTESVDDALEEKSLLRKERRGLAEQGTASIPSSVNEVLSSQGQPLDQVTRSFMEPRFGHDFSRVRIHSDARAMESAQAVNALAYTVGHDVVFGAGQHAPGTRAGQRLLAHELAHVVQQASGQVASTPAPGGVSISNPSDSFEQAAEQASDAVMSGAAIPPMQTGSAGVIQRWTNPVVTLKNDQELIRDACVDRDDTAIHKISPKAFYSDPPVITVDQKLIMIDVIVNQGFVGPLDENALFTLWDSFRDQFAPVASVHMDLWTKSVNRYAFLLDLPAVKKLGIDKIQEPFEKDVAQVVSDNLTANRTALIDRKKMHGLGDAKSLTDAQYKELQLSIQEMAHHVWVLKQAQNELRDTTVGAESVAIFPVPAKFNPERKPNFDLASLGRTGPKWDDLKVAWDATAQEIAHIAGRYPEIYAALATDKPEEELLYLSRVIPEAFEGKIGQLLDGLLDRINDIQNKLKQQEISLLDLEPVHERLFQGLSVTSGKEWGKANSLDQWAAKRLLSRHEKDEKVVKYLLSAVEITALLVASFVSAGSLTFFVATAIAVGAPAIQGAIDWGKAAKQDEMAKATPLQGTELITQAKADAMKAQAVSELVRALINAITLGVTAGIKEAGIKLEVEAAGASAGFSKAEQAIVEEVKGILSSSELAELRAAVEANKVVRVRYGLRYIQFEPDIPVGRGYYAVTDFQGNGFALGRDAFSSEQELAKTLLWEVYRLTTTGSKIAGVSGELAAAETTGAQDFSEKAFKAFFSGK